MAIIEYKENFGGGMEDEGERQEGVAAGAGGLPVAAERVRKLRLRLQFPNKFGVQFWFGVQFTFRLQFRVGANDEVLLRGVQQGGYAHHCRYHGTD